MIATLFAVKASTQLRRAGNLSQSSNVAIGCCDGGDSQAGNCTRSIVYPTPTTGFSALAVLFQHAQGWLVYGLMTYVRRMSSGVVFSRSCDLVRFEDYNTMSRFRTTTRDFDAEGNETLTSVVFDFPEKPESNQSGVAVENAKEFSDVSDFILNINNELEDLPLGNYKIATTTEKRVQKVWSNKQKVIIIVNSSAHLLLRKSLFEFEDSSDLLQWLENCTDPWDTVESHWIRTAGTRLKLPTSFSTMEQLGFGRPRQVAVLIDIVFRYFYQSVGAVWCDEQRKVVVVVYRSAADLVMELEGGHRNSDIIATAAERSLARLQVLTHEQTLARERMLALQRTLARERALASDRTLAVERTLALRRTLARAPTQGRTDIVATAVERGQARMQVLAHEQALARDRMLAQQRMLTRERALASNRALSLERALALRRALALERALARESTLAQGWTRPPEQTRTVARRRYRCNLKTLVYFLIIVFTALFPPFAIVIIAIGFVIYVWDVYVES
ncbi:hypothetical protein EVAR_57010_1 [Eumeta japonica]|uniref:Uncharacterized protein n=1 Tax=Eumeta variegata TaxID=151549 RepID=A0A4C1ZS85_EUMVA|nr:hypothetical protein EVAR_57010_1 [Eumeta japonica]